MKILVAYTFSNNLGSFGSGRTIMTVSGAPWPLREGDILAIEEEVNKSADFTAGQKSAVVNIMRLSEDDA